MKFVAKKSVVRSGLSAALSLVVLSAVPSLAQADALAQSILAINGFKLTTPGTVPTNGAVSGVGSIDVNLNGVNTPTAITTFPAYSATSSLGAGYVPNTKIMGAVTNTFAGGLTQVTGNAFAPAGASAISESAVSLKPAGTGFTNSLTGTSFEYTFSLGQSSSVGIEFSADLFMRAFLAGTPILVTTPAANATVNVNWSISIQDATGTIFNWAPNGVIDQGSITGGTETKDAFSLNRGIGASRLLPTPGMVNSVGSFEAQSNVFGAGNYTLTINHKTDARANVQVPEPGTLALVGLSMLGLAAVGRRRATRQAA